MGDTSQVLRTALEHQGLNQAGSAMTVVIPEGRGVLGSLSSASEGGLASPS